MFLVVQVLVRVTIKNLRDENELMNFKIRVVDVVEQGVLEVEWLRVDIKEVVMVDVGPSVTDETDNRLRSVLWIDGLLGLLAEIYLLDYGFVFFRGLEDLEVDYVDILEQMRGKAPHFDEMILERNKGAVELNFKDGRFSKFNIANLVEVFVGILGACFKQETKVGAVELARLVPDLLRLVVPEGGAQNLLVRSGEKLNSYLVYWGCARIDPLSEDIVS